MMLPTEVFKMLFFFSDLSVDINISVTISDQNKRMNQRAAHPSQLVQHSNLGIKIIKTVALHHEHKLSAR